MALDGILLRQLQHEIFTEAEGARIDRIAQPFRDEIILHLRWPGGAKRLLLSANPSNPRIHFVKDTPENPQTPPMFCMLLRKHLAGARLVDIRQEGMDRILYLVFEALNEFGDVVSLTLVHEIMGRHSNIILVDEKGMILDGIKRAGFETATVRQILPNIRYHLPPGQDKLTLGEHDLSDVFIRLREEEGSLSRGIMNTIQGMSPLPSREIAHLALGTDQEIADIGAKEWSLVQIALTALETSVLNNTTQPTMLINEDGRPQDFTFLPIHQYGSAMENKDFPTFSTLLETFYKRRSRMDQMRQLSTDLHRTTTNIHDRILRRLAAQKEELLATKDRDQLRIVGDILTANIYALEKGQSEARLVNFYSEDPKEIVIPLDSSLTPAENAQAYYARYRKADTAEKKLTEQIAKGESELEYVESVIDSLERSTSASELDSIRQELMEEGYLQQKKKSRRQAPRKLPPYQYKSSDGFTILAGRNNVQNEQLSLRSSQRHDIWLHVQKIPGSHVIIQTENREVPNTTVEEAAMIAAQHSKAQDSTNVPVDYTQVFNVKKQRGGRPGMVTYDNFQTIFVTPDENVATKLEVL